MLHSYKINLYTEGLQDLKNYIHWFIIPQELDWGDRVVLEERQMINWVYLVIDWNVVWFDYLKIGMNNYVKLVKSWYQTGQEYISTYT
jgi:hypothetical protein